MKGRILYVMDPLCGWCYGFSEVMQELQEKYKGEYEFTVIPGGMITGARIAPVSDMANYILSAYSRVEEYSGVKFGKPYLDLLREGSEINNSEPPCRAIHLFKQKDPARIVDFTHELQLAIFRDGKSWNADSTYFQLAEAFGADPQSFVNELNTDECKYGTQQEFQWVQAAGITGFPCTVLEKEGKYYLLSQGYKPLSALEEVVEKIDTTNN
jgi:putative protein-disulfide isomerase